MKNPIEEKTKITVTFQECKGGFICKMGALPIVGCGASPVESLQSLAEAVPEAYRYWSEGLTIKHAQQENSLITYKDLMFMVRDFANENRGATFYSPVGDDGSV